MMLEVRGVRKSFNDQLVLDDIEMWSRFWARADPEKRLSCAA